MPEYTPSLTLVLGATSVRDEVLSVLAGLAFTGGLFFGIAHFEHTGAGEPPVEIEDLRMMSIPVDPPPPRVVEQPPAAEAAAPFAGLEIGATDSPVKIAVMPPDIAALMPVTDVAPAAVIQSSQLYSSFKPKMDLAVDFNRVFQHTEVDQKPTVLSRPNPRIPKHVRKDAEMLRVSLLVLIDARGGVSSVRVLKPSGNEAFDQIVAQSVRTEWAFTPATKHGRKVRCLLQQAVTVTWKRGGGDPFTL